MLSAHLFRLEPVWSRVYRLRRLRGGWGRAVGALLLSIFLALLLGLWAAPAMALAASPPPSPKLAPQGAAPGASPGSSSSSPQWVTLDGRRILELRAVAGAQSLASVANRGSALLQELARKGTVAPEQLVVQEDPPYSMIGVIDAKGQYKPFLAVDDRAGRAFEISRQQLAELYRDQLRGAIRQYRSTHSLTSWLRGTALALLVLGAYLLWLRLQGDFYQRLREGILRGNTPWLGGVSLAGSQVLDSEQERGAVLLLLRVLHWGVLLLASYLMIPLLLGFFPPTQGIAEGLRGHIRLVLDGVLEGVVAAIPNLLAIALILLFTRMAMRACRTWFAAIERGRLQFPGFYREWARPTGRLVAAAILVAGLVSAYPYIPGSDSKAFQGAGLFVGVLAALGSSAVATNVISGLMLIYTRAFREGDRVEINDVIGVVQDRDLLVTRIQTPRNELVSIPNATVIGASIVNFSFARREIAKPVALATTITIGYDVPWRQVHALLLKAAWAVPGIAADPQPFVLQISLNDFNISYELNASVRDVMTYRETLSDLLASIQDVFAEADVEILSPTYECNRDGSARTVPPLPSLDLLRHRPG